MREEDLAGFKENRQPETGGGMWKWWRQEMLISLLKSSGISQLRFRQRLGPNRKIDSGRRRLALVFLSEPEQRCSQLWRGTGHSTRLRPSSRDLSSHSPFHLSPALHLFPLSASCRPSFLGAHLARYVSFCQDFSELTPISPHPITTCRRRRLRGSCMARVCCHTNCWCNHTSSFPCLWTICGLLTVEGWNPGPEVSVMLLWLYDCECQQKWIVRFKIFRGLSVWESELSPEKHVWKQVQIWCCHWKTGQNASHYTW